MISPLPIDFKFLTTMKSSQQIRTCQTAVDLLIVMSRNSSVNTGANADPSCIKAMFVVLTDATHLGTWKRLFVPVGFAHTPQYTKRMARP